MTDSSLISELLQLVSSSSTIHEFLSAALPPFAKHCGVKQASIWSAVGGRWECVAHNDPTSEQAGVSAALIELLAESSDEGNPIVRDGRLAYPLPRPLAGGGDEQTWHASVLILNPATDAAVIDTVNRLAPSLQTLIRMLAGTTHQHRRVERLESLLKIANSWYQIREMEPLLRKMAEVATELLHAERATIFLWDRRKKQLVGRPALGVADNELRIPDDTGIVGRVLRTGKAERADSDDPSIAQIEDPESGFRTRNLVCVPLISQRGRTLGAFELLNRRDGEFTMQDETELAELAASASAAIENCSNYQSLLATRADEETGAGENDLIGNSPAMVKLQDMIDRVAPSDLPVLILGENGTGKEVVSRRIHQLSKRSREPFLAVNCAALTKSLLESELFGHEKGAFTDAHESRAGKFEAATGGILMLDEIGELPLESQSKLLRVLEEQKVVRVGGTESRAIDTRVIAATNRDLGAMVRDRTFREDLFFRLNVVTLELPPLRERGDDIMLLAERFLEEFCEASAREVPKFTGTARKRLIHHNWPGNVRELRNLMERLAFLNTEAEIDADELPFSEDQADAASMELSLSDATREFQSDYIRSQIRAAGGNMTEAARRMGLHRSNLYRKMGQLGLDDQVD